MPSSDVKSGEGFFVSILKSDEMFGFIYNGGSY